MDTHAPTATKAGLDLAAQSTDAIPIKTPSSIAHVTVIGCGGAGINLARPFKSNPAVDKVLYFDTSVVNSRPGESINIVANGDGSGSNRAENARAIEGYIPNIPDTDLGLNDVMIVMSSLSGGSGSIISPLLARECLRRKARVIMVLVADTGSSVWAKNTLNTLKTFAAICKNNNVYLPVVLLTNDTKGRLAADEVGFAIVTDLIDLLTNTVSEVDKNDRLNWVDPTKVVSSSAGIKILAVQSQNTTVDASVALGSDSAEMVDSMLVIQDYTVDATPADAQRPARLKKVGFHTGTGRTILGTVSSDIAAIEKVIDFVETIGNLDKSQNHHSAVSRLESQGNGDLIL